MLNPQIFSPIFPAASCVVRISSHSPSPFPPPASLSEFESVDKTGGFIGSMYVNKTENVAVELVRAGLASTHAFTAEALSFSKALFAAEEDAKKGRKGVSDFAVGFSFQALTR